LTVELFFDPPSKKEKKTSRRCWKEYCRCYTADSTRRPNKRARYTMGSQRSDCSD